MACQRSPRQTIHAIYARKGELPSVQVREHRRDPTGAKDEKIRIEDQRKSRLHRLQRPVQGLAMLQARVSFFQLRSLHSQDALEARIAPGQSSRLFGWCVLDNDPLRQRLSRVEAAHQLAIEIEQALALVSHRANGQGVVSANIRICNIARPNRLF